LKCIECDKDEVYFIISTYENMLTLYFCSWYCIMEFSKRANASILLE